MPCDAGVDWWIDEDQDRMRKELDLVTRIARYYCQRHPVPYWAQEWWEEHQDRDRRRMEMEEAKERAKDTVFVSLTKKEYDEYLKRQCRD